MKFGERLRLAARALLFGSDDWVRALKGYETASGQIVTADTAMRIATVNACVRILSETIASLPLHVYQRLDNGGKERAPDHPLYELLHSRPNPWQTSFDFREQMMSHLLLRGNFFAVKLYHGDLIIDDLIPLNPDNVTVLQLPDYSLQYQISGTGAGTLILGQKDVLHIRGLSRNGILGESVIAQARDTFGSALATQEYAGKFWRNDATPAGIIKVAKKLEKGEADRIREIWTDDHGGSANAHKLHVLGDGASFEKIEMTAEDSQLIETRRFQRSELASLFRVPLMLLQADTQTTTYASSEQFMLAFAMHSIRPWLVRIEQALQMQLFTAPQKYFPEFNLDGLLRGDLKSRYEAYKIARDAGWMSKNDIREKENMNPIENGDDYRSLAELQNARNLTGGT
jgi:HK97 family phage portal protein